MANALPASGSTAAGTKATKSAPGTQGRARHQGKLQYEHEIKRFSKEGRFDCRERERETKQSMVQSRTFFILLRHLHQVRQILN
jgi:hypothetical protein